MAHFPLIFFFLLVSVLMLSLSCVTALDPVDNVCSRTRNSSLCSGTLRSDPRSATATITRLGYLAIDLALSHAATTTNKINTLLGRAKDPGLKNSLRFCQVEYVSYAKLACRKAFIFLNQRDYSGSNTQGFELSEVGSICERKCVAGPSYLRQLTIDNRKTELFGDIIVVVSALLKNG
ncbi:hypothetical protein C3L33_13031, partial [Rhododendron williamsianum]